jgi:hypothetical protein
MTDWKKEYNEAACKMMSCISEEKEKYEVICRDLVKNNFPKSLYKYSHFDDNGYWKDLVNGKLFFQHPCNWNDLFDSVCTFEFNRLKAEAKEKLSQKGAKNSDEDIDLFIEKVTAKVIECNLGKEKQTHFTAKAFPSNELTAGPLMELAKKIEFCAIFTHIFRASCFCEDVDNMKMWYFYAKEYSGFCVEYDFSKLNDANIKPVIYIDKKFQAKDFSYPFYETEMFLPMLLKNSCWKDEKEWRFIFPNKHEDGGIISNCPVKAIYLGNKISPDNENELISLLKSAGDINLKIYRMIIDKYQNNFVAEQINVL